MEGGISYGQVIAIKSVEEGSLLCAFGSGTTDKSMLDVKMAGPSRGASHLYTWKMLPSEGSGKKIGDPIHAGDTLSLCVVEPSATSQRKLAVKKVGTSLDTKLVVADKMPGSLPLWKLTGITKLMTEADSYVADPSGDFMNQLQYGPSSYFTLTNVAVSGNLCVVKNKVQTSLVTEKAKAWWVVLNPIQVVF